MRPRRWQRAIGSSWLGGVWLGGRRQRIHKLLKDILEFTGREDVEVIETSLRGHHGGLELYRDATDGHPIVYVDSFGGPLRTEYDREKARDWIVPIVRQWPTVTEIFAVENYGDKDLTQAYRELASIGPLYLNMSLWELESGGIPVQFSLSTGPSARFYFELYPRMPPRRLNKVREYVETMVVGARSGALVGRGEWDLEEEM